MPVWCLERSRMSHAISVLDARQLPAGSPRCACGDNEAAAGVAVPGEPPCRRARFRNGSLRPSREPGTIFWSQCHQGPPISIKLRTAELRIAQLLEGTRGVLPPVGPAIG